MKHHVNAQIVHTALALLAAPLVTNAAVVSFDQPAMDVWMYENGFDRGTRANAPVFAGPIGTGNGSDDRLGQFLLGWNTAAAGIPTGLQLSSYQITRVTFKATNINENVFAYDPSYDSYQTYLDAGDPNHTPDGDSGRPIELHGIGFRNGYTDLAVGGEVSGSVFTQTTPTMGVAGEHGRHVFAWAPNSPRADGDISDNVSDRFDPTAFAIGINENMDPGDFVPADTEFTFELNLENPAILTYLQRALQDGTLGLMLSSLHPSSFSGQPGAQSYPRFYTREYYDVVDFVVPQLEIEYAIVPEPSAVQILILIGTGFAMIRGIRRRDRFS